MKYQISFALNAQGTSFSITDHQDDVPAALQNITALLQGLQSHFLERKMLALSNPSPSPAIQAATLASLDEKIKLASQITENLKITATFEDGNSTTWPTSPTPEEVFLAEYQALCAKHKMAIVPTYEGNVSFHDPMTIIPLDQDTEKFIAGTA